MANGNDVNGSIVGRILGSLENRTILIIIAGVLGVSGNQLLQWVDPNTVRPDPYTGTEGREVERRVDELEKSQALDDAHRARADEGWILIYEMHEDIAVIKERINHHTKHD